MLLTDRRAFMVAVNILRFWYYSIRRDVFLLLMAHQLLEKKNYNLATLFNGL